MNKFIDGTKNRTEDALMGEKVSIMCKSNGNSRKGRLAKFVKQF